ncbi:uncharacterized protein BCR38DRAFT_340913 [Pseudomassariella vexata]|uniref:Prp 4 CRoW domain-containing protein n=1 Tax=Pseudomassariella vexata TaxID=1141098 RepID=A0A1Y2E1B4_9PEZI|nr:uncharacterized protein BCR38DRAFT_340913 [Pseudomassariella vexata]ORY65328.1 hypothetical protein BCR38DRAFT_340913 [Pseudomassariella vexata]
MLFHASLAVTALAGLAAAEPVPQPYKLNVIKMSVRDIFGLERRQDGYQPSQTFCGTGLTCTDACGAGFEQCDSTDATIHCFDPTAKQTCCGTGTGDSCDEGYFCSSDSAGATWCCPDGLSLEECAKQYSVTGGLSSELPASTPVGVSMPTTSSVETASTASTSATPAVTGTDAEATADRTTYISEIVKTVVPTAASAGSNTTGVSPTFASTSTLPVQAAASKGSTSFVALLAALAFAAIL